MIGDRASRQPVCILVAGVLYFLGSKLCVSRNLVGETDSFYHKEQKNKKLISISLKANEEEILHHARILLFAK